MLILCSGISSVVLSMLNNLTHMDRVIMPSGLVGWSSNPLPLPWDVERLSSCEGSRRFAIPGLASHTADIPPPLLLIKTR